MTTRNYRSPARSLSIALTLAVFTTAMINAGEVSDPIGCYLATPPLGSRPTTPVLDTALAFFKLDSAGSLRRPLLSAPPERTRGHWFARSDSLFVTYSDGFTGESYKLRTTSNDWTGIADHITDELGTPPVQRAAVWTRVPCR